ncbi:MAG: dTDP-4-dehydrorhamnose 3,5-epimerase, partial [Candidatus Aminicenantes bacterium RBG_16_66_30]
MEFKPAAIPDVILITPRVHSDERGFLMETYQ